MKIKLTLEIEDDAGEIVERIARAIETLTRPIELPPPPEPERYMSGDPANFLLKPIPRRRSGGRA